ncbi:MAG: ATP-binding protein [Actinobacteria bacterium]|nr:ATP-binding protein [Actinomycetota bacterium]
MTADPQILASAVTNLLNNAFKFTRTGGRVVLKAHDKDGHVLIEVEDECGGIPESTGDPFQSFGEQRGRDRTGLGLGLAIARKAVRAHGGDIYPATHRARVASSASRCRSRRPTRALRRRSSDGCASAPMASLAPIMRLLSSASARRSGTQNQLTSRIDRGGPPKTS